MLERSGSGFSTGAASGSVASTASAGGDSIGDEIAVMKAIFGDDFHVLGNGRFRVRLAAQQPGSGSVSLASSVPAAAASSSASTSSPRGGRLSSTDGFRLLSSSPPAQMIRFAVPVIEVDFATPPGYPWENAAKALLDFLLALSAREHPESLHDQMQARRRSAEREHERHVRKQAAAASEAARRREQHLHEEIRQATKRVADELLRVGTDEPAEGDLDILTSPLILHRQRSSASPGRTPSSSRSNSGIDYQSTPDGSPYPSLHRVNEESAGEKQAYAMQAASVSQTSSAADAKPPNPLSPEKVGGNGKSQQENEMQMESMSFTSKSGRKFSFHEWEEIGRGAFGRVLKGWDAESCEVLAVKVVTHGGGAHELEEFEREVDILRMVQHPRVVSYLGVQRTAHELRVFLEYLPGGSLASLLQRVGPLPERAARRFARQALEGLVFLHARGVVHRDIKAANCLLDTSGNLKLGDFGCSSVLRSDALRSVRGTPRFMAPEVVRAEGYGAAADIWSLGCLVMELLVGHPPFQNLSNDNAIMWVIARGRQPPPIPESLSRAATAFIAECLQRDATLRPSASALLQHPFVAEAERIAPPSVLRTEANAAAAAAAAGAEGATLETLARERGREQETLGAASPADSTRADCGDSDNEDGENVGADAEAGADAKAVPAPERRGARHPHDPQREEARHGAPSIGPLARSIPAGLSRFESDFKALRVIGRGAYGEVWKARGRLDGRLYAIKRIRLRAAQLNDDRVLREVTTLSRLNHEFIVRYYQAWVEEAPPGDPLTAAVLCIQMEYCEQKTLESALRSGTTVPASEDVWKVMRQLLDGLAHVHANGIIHRDLKPANIFVDAKGDFHLGDFGLAVGVSGGAVGADSVAAAPGAASADRKRGSGDRSSFVADNPSASTKPAAGDRTDAERQRARAGSPALAPDEVQVSDAAGTPLYVAPEQMRRGARITSRADMFSLGLIFLELWCPMRDVTERLRVLGDARAGQFPPELDQAPGGVASLVRSMCSHDPAARPSALSILRSDLLPPKQNDGYIDDAIRAVTDERTTFYTRLLDALFSPTRRSSDSLDVTYDLGGVAGFRRRDIVLRENIEQVVRAVLSRRGGVPFAPGLLMPRASTAATKAVLGPSDAAVSLLDTTGAVVQLPVSLRTTFARYASRAPTVPPVRYAVAHVYRPGLAGGHPRRILEAAFDVVQPARCASADALVIDTVVAVMEALVVARLAPPRFTVYVGHLALRERALSDAGMSDEVRGVVERELSALSRADWVDVQRALRRGGVPESVLARIAPYASLCGTPLRSDASAVARLRELDERAADELSAVAVWLEHLGTPPHRVSLHPLMLHSGPEAVERGIVFQCFAEFPARASRERCIECVAAGGRYDGLLRALSIGGVAGNASAAPLAAPHAVGASFGLDKIAVVANECEAQPEYAPACEVHILSHGAHALRCRCLALAAELWRERIAARVIEVDGSTLRRDLVDEAVADGAKVAIVVKDRSTKVRDLESRAEETLPEADVPHYVARVVRDWRKRRAREFARKV